MAHLNIDADVDFAEDMRRFKGEVISESNMTINFINHRIAQLMAQRDRLELLIAWAQTLGD